MANRNDLFTNEEFLSLLQLDELEKRKHFPDQIAHRLAANFDIPHFVLPNIVPVLELGALRYCRQNGTGSAPSKSTRKELEVVSKAASKLTQTLSSLSDEAKETLEDAHFRMRLSSHLFSGLCEDDKDDLQHAESNFDLAALSEELKTFAAQASVGTRVAGAGRSGRPSDEAMFDLIATAFHAWESVLRRSYKLDWTDRNEPITEAARFSVSVAHAVDPTAKLSRIAYAARRVREKCLPANDLGLSNEIMDHYRKHFGSLE